MLRNKIFFTVKIFSLLAFGLLFSCAANDEVQNKANAEFEKRFGAQINKINATRRPAPNLNIQEESPITTNTPISVNKYASPEELLAINGALRLSSASVDTSKFSLKRAEDFSPDTQTFAAGQNIPKLPADIFDLNYNLELGGPFVVSGYEFDEIKIPEKDSYGVASTLNKKRYIIAGNNTLQKNIDDLISAQSAEDIEFSAILIKEQKQLKKQQKLAKIFGEDSSFVKEEKITNNKEIVEKAEEQKPAASDELKKAIALQVIKQNIAHNSNIGANGSINNAATQKIQ